MTKFFSVRIRTFTIPVFAVFSYVFGQIFAQILTLFIYSPKGSSPESPVAVLETHSGSTILFESVFMFFLIGAALLLFRDTLSSASFFRKPTSNFSFFSFFVSMGMLGFSQLYFNFLQYLSMSSGGLSDLLEEYSAHMETRVQGVEQICFFIGLAIFIPVVEEFIFRGFIMGEFMKTMHPIFAIILSSLIFGAIHIQPLQIGYAFFCGMFLGSFYFLSKNFLLVCLIHMFFNFFGGVLPVLLPENSGAYWFLGNMYFLSLPISLFYMYYLWKEGKKGNANKEYSA